MGCGSLVGVTESGGLCGCYGVYVVLIVLRAVHKYHFSLGDHVKKCCVQSHVRQIM